MLEFDQAGNLLRHWGGPRPRAIEWPESNHGITIDYKGNVWIGGNGGNDGQVLKFTKDGKFLDAGRHEWARRRQQRHVGTSGGSRRSSSTRREERGLHRRRLRQQARRRDRRRHRQVQALSGAPTATSRTTRTSAATTRARRPRSSSATRCTAPSCRRTAWSTSATASTTASRCSRRTASSSRKRSSRKNTLGDGSVWDIAFSKDPQQKYIYLADGANEKVYILDRQSLQVLTSFGDGGRQPGQFYGVHSIATDSKGNIYTTETYEGKRVQQFVYKGIGPVDEGEPGRGLGQPHDLELTLQRRRGGACSAPTVTIFGADARSAPTGLTERKVCPPSPTSSPSSARTTGTASGSRS